MEVRFNRGFFTLPVWGAYNYLEALIHGGAYFRNFTVIPRRRTISEISLNSM